MRIAIDRGGDGVVDNVIEAASLAAAQALFPGDVVFASETVGPGWVKNAQNEYEPPTTPANVPVYRPIDKVEAMGLIRTVTAMTPAQEMAFRDDPNLALFWRIWREDVGSVIHRDHPLTAQIIGALQATGYLNDLQATQVLAYWPTTAAA